jgi:hypothetical protein
MYSSLIIHIGLPDEKGSRIFPAKQKEETVFKCEN